MIEPDIILWQFINCIDYIQSNEKKMIMSGKLSQDVEQVKYCLF